MGRERRYFGLIAIVAVATGRETFNVPLSRLGNPKRLASLVPPVGVERPIERAEQTTI
jgi:hypothetical protein